MVDTSILIDFYRKTDKSNSIWVSLVRQEYEFAISVITKYEIYSGATKNQLEFWNHILRLINVIPFNEACVDTAVTLNIILKQKRSQIDIADLFIAATALTHNLPFSTLNKNHFNRIPNLEIIG
jgi:predicted nucleic acid-binding protein